jgi:hypothetical protein
MVDQQGNGVVQCSMRNVNHSPVGPHVLVLQRQTMYYWFLIVHVGREKPNKVAARETKRSLAAMPTLMATLRSRCGK